MTAERATQEALQDSERQLADELSKARTLQLISTELISEPDIASFYVRLLDAAMALMRSDAASVQMLDPSGTYLQLLASKHFHPDAERHWQRVEAGSATTCGQALVGGGRIVVTDVDQCSFIVGTPDHGALRQCGLRAVQSTPLVARNGQLLGMISTHWRHVHQPTPSDLRSFDVLARQAADLLERACVEDALRRAHADLELRVQERTLDLARANVSLQEEIRERRAAETRNKTLFQRLVSVQEDERRRIARDIHDRLGQQMTALKMSLETGLEDHPGRADDARRMRELADELDFAIDNLTSELRPAALDHFGLAAALQGLAAAWSERFRIRADFQATGAASLRLRPDVEANLYRLAQEALHNVAKHARATRVTLYLEHREEHAVLVIEDDGCGFDVDQVPTPESGLGLMNMRDRAMLAGGAIEIDSGAGRGTTIFVRVPARGEPDGAACE